MEIRRELDAVALQSTVMSSPTKFTLIYVTREPESCRWPTADPTLTARNSSSLSHQHSTWMESTQSSEEFIPECRSSSESEALKLTERIGRSKKLKSLAQRSINIKHDISYSSSQEAADWKRLSHDNFNHSINKMHINVSSI